MEQNKIDISGLDKAEVVAALYNRSRPQGLGYFQATQTDATTEQIREFIEARGGSLYFDYVQGRSMKVDLSGDTFDPWLYDRDNGQGAAARAIAELRRNN